MLIFLCELATNHPASAESSQGANLVDKLAHCIQLCTRHNEKR